MNRVERFSAQPKVKRVGFPELGQPAAGYNYPAKSLKFSAFTKFVSHSEELRYAACSPRAAPSCASARKLPDSLTRSFALRFFLSSLTPTVLVIPCHELNLVR